MVTKAIPQAPELPLMEYRILKLSSQRAFTPMVISNTDVKENYIGLDGVTAITNRCDI